MPFANRGQAGQRLAALLAERLGQRHDGDTVVLGLPRGGVPVAYEVAKVLRTPLDVIVVRKLGVPSQPELAMGAVGEDDVRVLNREVLDLAGIDADEFAEVERVERAEVDRRARQFRGGRRRAALVGRVAVIVDDGVATGATARAACQVARVQGARRVVFAAPVASRGAVHDLADVCDDVVCVETPRWLSSVGQWYDDFTQTPDREVRDLLEKAAERPELGIDRAGVLQDVRISSSGVDLAGQLSVPPDALATIVFAHGSGSSRHSPRNQFVADVLNEARFGTLLFDLLTPAEEGDRANVFDIPLLARRLVDAVAWLRTRKIVSAQPIGLFGASTGAAAALWAAAEPAAEFFAIVSRGGRPDLAGERLGLVRAPTLLIVGALDDAVLGLNRAAQAQLRAPSRLAVVPGASHLFEEPGTLPAAARLARDWFQQHASPLPRPARLVSGE